MTGAASAALSAASARAFADEVARINQRRLRLLLPLISIGHVAHVVVFLPSAAQRTIFSARVIEWREGVADVHAATLVVALALAVHALRRTVDRPSRILGPATAVTYLLHAAVVVGVRIVLSKRSRRSTSRRRA